MFPIGLEIVHIAALGNIHSVAIFPLLGSAVFNEFTGVFHHKLAFHEFLGGHHSPILAGNVADFEGQFGVIGPGLTKPL